jgi:hypothetical protein
MGIIAGDVSRSKRTRTGEELGKGRCIAPVTSRDIATAWAGRIWLPRRRHTRADPRDYRDDAGYANWMGHKRLQERVSRGIQAGS